MFYSTKITSYMCLSQLKEFDKEMECFAQQLFEFPIHFAPSYPYMEDTQVGHHYMRTRCPAWCDRVVLSETAKLLVHQVSSCIPLQQHVIYILKTTKTLFTLNF